MFRALAKLGGLRKIGGIKANNVIITPTRSSGGEAAKWCYRSFKSPEDIPRHSKVKADFIMTFMWYYVLWHIWYNSDRLIGHYPYVEGSMWTDEELGIPKED